MKSFITPLLVLFFACFCLHSSAQVDDRDWILNIMPQVGIPVGKIKETHGATFGGHLQFEGKLADKTRYLVQLGGGLLQGKEYDAGGGYRDTYPALTIAQLRGGGKYFPAGGFFVAGLIGAAQSFSRGESSLGLSYAPVIGFEFGNVKYFDISVRYDASNFKSYKVTTATFSIGYHL